MEFWGAARRSPERDDAVEALGTAMLLSDDPVNAARVFEKLLESGRGAGASRHNLAAAYYRTRDFEKAAALLVTIIASDPQNAPAYFNLALVRLAQDQEDEMLAALKTLSSFIQEEELSAMLSDAAFERWANSPAFQALRSDVHP
jgi:tetratricopeptide (TPR) repeat protein